MNRRTVFDITMLHFLVKFVNLRFLLVLQLQVALVTRAAMSRAAIAVCSAELYCGALPVPFKVGCQINILLCKSRKIKSFFSIIKNEYKIQLVKFRGKKYLTYP